MRGTSPEIKEAHPNSQFLARTGALLRCPLFKKDTPADYIFLGNFVLAQKT